MTEEILSLQMLFFSIIVRFDRIGGYEYLAQMNEQRFGPMIWYDRDIVRFGGAMSYDDVQTIIESYDSMGLSVTTQQDGISKWADLCVVGSMVGISDRECDWIRYDAERNTVTFVDGDEFVVLADQKLHKATGTPGTRIVGSVQTGNDPEAGVVQFDDLPFGYNYDKHGMFELFIPKPVVTKLISLGSKHSVTVQSYHTGGRTTAEFQLEDKDQIDLGVVEV